MFSSKSMAYSYRSSLLFNKKDKSDVQRVWSYPVYALLPTHRSLMEELFHGKKYLHMLDRSRALEDHGLLSARPYEFFNYWAFNMSVISDKPIQDITAGDVRGLNIFIHEPGKGFKDIYVDECFADPLGGTFLKMQRHYKGIAQFTIAQACQYYFKLYPFSWPWHTAVRLHAEIDPYYAQTYHRCGFYEAPSRLQSHNDPDVLMHLSVFRAWRFLRRYRAFQRKLRENSLGV